jgi:hypothetical protein
MADINLKVPAIEKLIDYGASGVGAIAGPLLAPWKASREGKARLIAAETDARIGQIQATTDANALSIIAEAQSKARAYMLPSGVDAHTTLDITRENVSQAIEFQTRKRLTNSRVVLEAAADELGDKEVDDHEPAPDWTARFFDCVQDVSSQDMQKIWAKILAGEVERPGRTSLRTLDTLRNMTKRDAELFRDICPFIISNVFVFYNDTVKDLNAIAVGNLLHLQDCGMVTPGRGLETVLQWEEDCIAPSYQGGVLKITNMGIAGGQLRIPAIRLTPAGRELSRLSPQCVDTMDYLHAFSKFLKSRDCRLEYLPDVEHLPDGMIRYANSITIEPYPDQPGGATP